MGIFVIFHDTCLGRGLSLKLTKSMNMCDEFVRKVLTVLDTQSISYWIDSGTLLGFVRDKSILHWDSDIDLGIWSEDFDAVFGLSDEFTHLGFHISTRSYKGVIYGITLNPNNEDNTILPIHIHIYFHEGDLAWSPQTVVYKCEEPLVPDWIAAHPSKMRDFLTWAKLTTKNWRHDRPAALWERAIAGLFYIPFWGAMSFARKKLKLDRHYWTTLYPLSLYNRISTWVVPAKFFLEIATIRVGEMELSVPKDYGQYLTARYGYWHISKQDWVYWRDDLWLGHQTPQEIFNETEY